MNTRCGLGRMGKSRDEKGWLLSLARGRRTGETEMALNAGLVLAHYTHSPRLSLSSTPHHVPVSFSLSY